LDEEAAALPPVPESTEQKVERLEDESLSAMLALAEVYEDSGAQNAEQEQDSITTMLALTETYGQIVASEAAIAEQQSIIAALTARLEALEAQAQQGGE